MPKKTSVVTEGCKSYLEQNLFGQNMDSFNITRKIIAVI